MFQVNILASAKKIRDKIREIGVFQTVGSIVHKSLVNVNSFFTDTESRLRLMITTRTTKTPLPISPISHQIILEGLRCKNEKIPLNHSEPAFISLDSHCLEFTWLVPFFSKGSGGHKSLFRFIKGLESIGVKCVIYIVGEYEYDLRLTPEKIKQKIWQYFETIEAEVKIYSSDSTDKKANILVSTSWITAYAALTFNADKKVYFVQDYEPSFYSMGSYWYLAEATYHFGYHHVTLGIWLTNLLKQKYDITSDYYNIVVDRDIYYPREKINNKNIKLIGSDDNFKICFYGRSVTPRRCFELVVMALHLFSEQVKDKDITLICFGWNKIPPLPFNCYNLGVLTPGDLAELYSVCDICIAPSATNLSLVANEVMACGCILMDIDAENTLYDLHHLENSYLVKPDPQSIYEGLLHLYNDRQLLEKLKVSSLGFALSSPTWQSQVDKFYNLVTRQEKAT